MSTLPRYTLALVFAFIVGFGFRAFDQLRGAEWIVSPRQIADAHAAGKSGYETAPGTVALLPIRSEMADVFPLEWILAGALVGAAVLAATKKPSHPG